MENKDWTNIKGKKFGKHKQVNIKKILFNLDKIIMNLNFYLETDVYSKGRNIK